MIYYLFLFSIFFPFLSPFPINSDIQPVFILFSIPLTIKYYSKNTLFFFFFIAIFLVLYDNPSTLIYNEAYNYKKIFSFVVAIYIYLLFHQMIKKDYFLFMHKLTRVLNISIFVYFIYSLLILIFPSLFNKLQSLFIRNLNSTDIFSERGISTFSTEPGLFAGILIFMLLLTDYLKDNRLINKKKYYLNFSMIISMIILTKSGTGYTYLLLYFILKHNSLYYRLLFFVFLIVLLLVLYLYDPTFISNNRGFVILKEFIDDPNYIFKDLSIYTRCYSALTGVNCLINNPIGYGTTDVNKQIFYNVILSNDYLYNFPKLYDFHNIYLVSGVAYLICMYGIFGVLILTYLLSKSKTYFVNKFFAILLATFSFSFAFPLTWLLLNLKRK